MDIRNLSPFISVSSQITPEDVDTAASMGFKTIVCNRPDNESEGQVNSEAIRLAAEENGLAFEHLPVLSGQITDGDVTEFQSLIKKVQDPILAYCRTGTRSCTLWALRAWKSCTGRIRLWW